MSVATDDDKAIAEHSSAGAKEPVPTPSNLFAAKQQAQIALLKAITRAAETYDRQGVSTFGQALQLILEAKS